MKIRMHLVVVLTVLGISSQAGPGPSCVPGQRCTVTVHEIIGAPSAGPGPSCVPGQDCT